MKKIEWEFYWSSNPMSPRDEYWGEVECLHYIIEYDHCYSKYNIYFDDSGECCYFDKIYSSKGEIENLKLLVELHANIHLDEGGWLRIS